MTKLYVVVDMKKQRATLVKARSGEEASDRYFSWHGIDKAEITEEDRMRVRVVAVFTHDFVNGVFEIVSGGKGCQNKEVASETVREDVGRNCRGCSRDVV